MRRDRLHLFPLISVLLLFPTLSPGQATYPAASCSEAAVQAAYSTEQASAQDGDIIAIPAGTCTWTSAFTISPANSLTFQGAGAEYSNSGGASTSGTDSTIIQTDVDPWFYVTTTLGKSYRFTGIAIYENVGYPCCSNGSWEIQGSSTAVRIDHNHFVGHMSGQRTVWIGGSVLGVADHNVIDYSAGVINPFAIENGRAWNGDPLGMGDYSWADSSYWGSSKFFFIEDNYLNNNFGSGTGGYINDCSVGGRQVIRYNTLNVAGTVQAHEMNGSNRGCRASEVYQNTYLNSSEANNAAGSRSGTFLVWGNTLQQVKNIFNGFQDRIEGINGIFSPQGYAMCGNGDTSNGFVGIVNTNGTSVALVSGNNAWGANVEFPFTSPASWPSESDPHVYINGAQYTVSSVSSAMALTLTTSAGTQTNVPYYVPSVWDGNHDATGYPCLDMPGRGAGDLLTGTIAGNNRIDSVTGTATWPHEVLDPSYVWDNTNTWPGDTSDAVVALAGDVFQDNRDYYQQMAVYCWGPSHNSCGENPGNVTLSSGQSVAFTGAAGIGQGLLAARPSTCTAGTDPMTGGSAPGVGYWATDAANPQDANNPGVLYVCNPTNTWTAYYTPYTYPHPLTQGAETLPAPPTSLAATVD